VLGEVVSWIVALGAVLGEAWFGAWWGKRRLGHPLSADQRGRIALYYTGLFTFPLAALLVALFAGKIPVAIVDRIEQLSRAHVAAGLVALVLVLASVALLRFLLLSLFSPRPLPLAPRAPSGATPPVS
jgi:hypothetical protein